MYENRSSSDAFRRALSRLFRGVRRSISPVMPSICSILGSISFVTGRGALWALGAAVLLLGIVGCGGGSSTTSDDADTASASAPSRPAEKTSGWTPLSDSTGGALPITFAAERSVSGGSRRDVLQLEPDGTYRLMRTMGDSSRIDIGRWHRAADGTRLTLYGRGDPLSFAWSAPDTIRAGTTGSEIPASEIALPLVRTSGPLDATATMRLTGRYLYYADAGRFRPCRTGIDMRVAQEEANARLERAYLNARPAPQSRVRATVDGRFEQRPRIDNPGREDVLVVERVVRIDPDGRCGRGDAPLTGTTWRLVQLGDRLLSPGAPEATLRLTESDSTVAGSGGCNRFGGRYRLDDPTGLSFSGIAATKRLCEEATMRVEDRFLEALHRAERFRVAHRSLELFRGETRLARFRATGGDEASE